MNGHTLLVSNHVKRIEISLSEISSVEESSWWGSSPRTVTLKLKSKSEFGQEIAFVPRGFGFLATDSANELRLLLKNHDSLRNDPF